MTTKTTKTVRATPFAVSYHGDSTIIIDAAGNWVTGQVPRDQAEEIAKKLTEEQIAFNNAVAFSIDN